MIACVCECISCSGCNCEWSVARKTTARSVHPLGTFRSTSRVTHRAYYDTPSTHAHLPERDRYIRDSIKRVVNRRIKISIKIIPDTRFLPTSRSVSPCLHEVWFTNSIHNNLARNEANSVGTTRDKVFNHVCTTVQVYSTRGSRHAFRRERTSNFIMSRDEVLTVLTWWPGHHGRKSSVISFNGT